MYNSQKEGGDSMKDRQNPDQFNPSEDRSVRQDVPGKPCIGFALDDPGEAFNHMKDKELIIDYGDVCGKKILHTWDDGRRLLMRCRKCGGYILVQMSEFHGEEDSYYTDYFPVSGPGEARAINEKYSGEEIEMGFPDKWMICEGGPHWNRS